MRIVSSSEMRALDQSAVDSIGIPNSILMENAGLEAARIISRRCVELNYDGEILIFCGKGKNGGDGLVVARRLLTCGHKIRIFLMHQRQDYTSESAQNLRILENLKAKMSVVDSALVLDEYFKQATPPFVVVDALLGTGLARNVEGYYYDTIELINKNADECFALDIPSGVMGDDGQIAGTSILATTTISFGYPKLGHFLAPGATRRGQLFNVDLNFPRGWKKLGDKLLLTSENTSPLLKSRDRFGHKNSFGHCLLIGGSPGRIGAIVMASHACLKMGTGLVTVASWQDSFPTLEVKLLNEIMNFRIEKDAEGFSVPKPGLSNFTSVVVGPGIGLHADAAKLIKQLLVQYSGPVVIDADGLTLISENDLYDDLIRRRHPTVLTPHPGEMARLLKCSKADVVANPIGSVQLAAEKTGAVVLLKGATSMIHSSESVTWFNHYPNDGMATAGSGDVLAGMIGGLLGQGMSATDSTRLGVYLHSISGQFAAKTRGHRSMTALDLIDNIGNAFSSLRDFKSKIIADPTTEIR